jgi:predicted MPP superfamily phosphohydrolase
MTLVYASDLHHCDNVPVVQAICAVQAQAILVGGDFIHDATAYTKGFDFLRACAAMLPTYCVLGNHEMRFEGDIRACVRETGAMLLDNDSVMLGEICLGGLSTGYAPAMRQRRTGLPPRPDVAFLQRFSAQEGYKLLLSHHPEYWEPYIRPLPVDLTVSGHAHGGQWRAFGRGAYAPGQGVFPRYTGGLYEGRLLVGRGLGNPYPIPRLFNPPELLLLHLQ